MKAALPAIALSLAVTLAACVPASREPAPAPVPVVSRTPAPPPPPVQAVPDDRWMDVAATPGDWRYGVQASRSEASFWSPGGAPMLRLRCLAESGRVIVSLPESGAQAPMVTIRTETATRTLAAMPADREMTIALDPRDPLLDAMALSKGRFAVETGGLAPLYLPSWAEVTRVIEDCR